MQTSHARKPGPLLIIWSFLRNISYLFLIFIVAYFLLYGTDQAKDFIISFKDLSEPGYFISVAVLLYFCSYITWYSASIILQISPVNKMFIEDELANKFCLAVSYVPAFILGTALLIGQAFLSGLVSLLLGVLFVLFFYWLNNSKKWRREWPSENDIQNHTLTPEGLEKNPTIKEEIRFIRKYPDVLFYFLPMGIFFLCLVVLLSFNLPLIWITRTLRPAAVIILILAFLTYVFTVLYYFHDIKTRPFLLFIVAWLIFCSYFNDNTKIPITQNFKELKDFRLTPSQAFTKWQKEKLSKWDSTHDSTAPMPVIFIATQGGGIRGELWTIEVLHELERLMPGFYNQVFCIGGASGGTVGAIYNNAFVYDTLYHKEDTANLKFENFRKFASADCLSPVTASFAFGENLQRFLPFPIKSLERSKVMMKAFSRSYSLNLNSNLADSNLLSMYYPGDDTAQFNCNIPSLFINGVLAETGQQVITSNLRLQGSPNFKYDVDFFAKVKGHISIAAASLNCMRFPLLLSAGLFNNRINCKNSYSIGHIVDGGYRENTGLQAMYSLMSELKEKLIQPNIKPFLIYIRNGGFEYDPAKADSTNAMRLLHDIGVPFRALLNVNGTSVPALGIMKMIQQQIENGNPLNMYYNQVWLKDSLYKPEEKFPLGHYMSNSTQVSLKDSLKLEEKFPLGLYMSDSAQVRLQRRAGKIATINVALVETLKGYFHKGRK